MSPLRRADRPASEKFSPATGASRSRRRASSRSARPSPSGASRGRVTSGSRTFSRSARSPPSRTPTASSSPPGCGSSSRTSSTAGRSALSLTGHALLELARSFGRIASEYDAVRPDYAPEAVARAQEALGLGPQARVVDLAAGSGTLTRALTRTFTDVVAIEPDDDMRAVLARQ